MKTNKLLTILMVFAVFVICSCSRASQENALSSADVEMELVNEQGIDIVEPIDRKIIQKGNIRFKTADVNKTKSLISQAVKELNGYISEDDVYDYSDRIEHRLTVRIPADKFDILLKNISESVDKIDSKNISLLDVTEEYIDVEARIKTKKELHAKYTELLKRATKVEEILNIEREIGNLQSELESIEGRLNYLKNGISFSTLTVSYYQKTKAKFDFSSKFVDGIKNGWSVFMWFIVGLSYLWVFIIVAIVVVCLVLQRKKRKSKSNNQQ
ncbi:hypothetical protein M2138_000661 [Dysgonomonadaceae bacterium PH5-43]|nr:hypothetical protein [Dysgonomonadaceae bacterium PH5-43]